MIVLEIVLCVFLLLLLAPRRAYPWVIAATVPTYASLYWIINRPLTINDNWGEIDRFIISIALFLGILPAVGRVLLVALRSDLHLSPELDWKPTQASCIFVVIWGGAWLLTPAIPAFAGATTCIAIGLLVSVAMFAAGYCIPSNRANFTTAGTALITRAAAILIWPITVIAAAEQRTAGRPYCIVVAHGINYRTAKTLLDLTPLIMRGQESRSSAWNFHGELLISGETARNWSYERFDYFDEASDHEPPHCAAKIGFARHLPWF
jgi:hypothetical protein